MRTIAQRRAADALARITELSERSARFKERYRSYVDRLGPAIVMNGLGQALATERAAAGPPPHNDQEKAGACRAVFRPEQVALPRRAGSLSGVHGPLASAHGEQPVTLSARPGRGPGVAGVHKKCCRACFPKGTSDPEWTLPLYQTDAPPRRGAHGHAGLWYDKFCNEWRIERSMWTLQDRKGAWIRTLTDEAVGCAAQIEESALRLAAMVDASGGRWDVFTTDSHFVTGLGRSHRSRTASRGIRR